MSSMYLNCIIGFSSKALRMFSSKSAINKIPYEGENFVSIVAPRICLKVFYRVQKCFFSTIFASSIRESLEICLLSLNSKNFWRVARPWLCGMLEQRPTTSITHRTVAPCHSCPIPIHGRSNTTWMELIPLLFLIMNIDEDAEDYKHKEV